MREGAAVGPFVPINLVQVALTLEASANTALILLRNRHYLEKGTKIEFETQGLAIYGVVEISQVGDQETRVMLKDVQVTA